MIAGEAAAFRAVEDLVWPYAADGALDLPVAAELARGRITVTAGRLHVVPYRGGGQAGRAVIRAHGNIVGSGTWTV